MKHLAVLFFILKISCINAQEIFAFQKQRHSLNKELITKNNTDEIFKKRFDREYEYQAKYLGKFQTNVDEFYIINSSYVNLKNLHNDNQILIYNAKKEFVGYFSLAANYQLPIKLVDNTLYFKTDTCINEINLSNGIPKAIRLSCRNNIDHIEFQNGR